MNEGTVRMKDSSVQIGLAGTRTGAAGKILFDEPTVANKEEPVLVLHLGDLCRCFSGDLQVRVEVGVCSSLGTGK